MAKSLIILTMLLSSEASAKIKVRKLLVTTQVSSWVEQKDVTKRFPAKGLFEITNGGAVEYIDHGLLEGIHQQFTNKDGKTVEVFVEDFGTPAKSLAMLNLKKQSFTETTPMTALPKVQGFTSKAIGAVIVAASMENIYVELTASGFSEDKESEDVAAAFLNYYQGQMK